ncbi:16S rRNA (cytosine(1402)-N(4))-methyltransferase, partial [Magnetococcales bacterium HHB-1]
MHEQHTPVLLNETIKPLTEQQKTGFYLDATFGRGGHTQALLETLPTAKVIAFDRDLEAIHYGQKHLLPQYPNRLILQHRAIHDIDDYLEQNQIAKIEGALFDLGVSSPQLDNPQRGFSFQNDGPLDMRMDPSDNYPTAAHLVNTLPEKDLAN